MEECRSFVGDRTAVDEMEVSQKEDSGDDRRPSARTAIRGESQNHENDEDGNETRSSPSLPVDVLGHITTFLRCRKTYNRVASLSRDVRRQVLKVSSSRPWPPKAQLKTQQGEGERRYSTCLQLFTQKEKHNGPMGILWAFFQADELTEIPRLAVYSWDAASAPEQQPRLPMDETILPQEAMIRRFINCYLAPSSPGLLILYGHAKIQNHHHIIGVLSLKARLGLSSHDVSTPSEYFELDLPTHNENSIRLLDNDLRQLVLQRSRQIALMKVVVSADTKWLLTIYHIMFPSRGRYSFYNAKAILGVWNLNKRQLVSMKGTRMSGASIVKFAPRVRNDSDEIEVPSTAPLLVWRALRNDGSNKSSLTSWNFLGDKQQEPTPSSAASVQPSLALHRNGNWSIPVPGRAKIRTMLACPHQYQEYFLICSVHGKMENAQTALSIARVMDDDTRLSLSYIGETWWTKEVLSRVLMVWFPRKNNHSGVEYLTFVKQDSEKGDEFIHILEVNVPEGAFVSFDKENEASNPDLQKLIGQANQHFMETYWEGGWKISSIQFSPDGLQLIVTYINLAHEEDLNMDRFATWLYSLQG